MRVSAALTLLSILFCALPAGAFEYQILNKSGSIEIAEESVETGGDSYADVAMDAALGGILRVGPSSKITVEGEESERIFLEKGSLFFYREKDKSAKKPWTLSAGGIVLHWDDGGGQLAISKNQVIVRVFAEKIEVMHKIASTITEVSEGLEWTLDIAKGVATVDRMKYEDYAAWESWIREVYEMKDDLAMELAEHGN